MFYKQIFRNWLPAVYLSIGILSFLLFLILVSISKESTFNWMIFTIGALSLNILNIGYFNFGFSFDYHKILNIRNKLQIKKFLIDQFKRILFCTFICSSILLLFLSAGDRINEKTISIIVCTLNLIPLQITCYILLFKKMNLFDNKFSIIRQTGMNYLTSAIQIILIIIYYFSINNLVHSLLLLTAAYLIFFFGLQNLTDFFIKKINDEYIRN